MNVLRGLRHIRIGVETTERAKQAHVFLSEIIPYTLKKITKDVKIRHVALECMGDVLARLSKSEHIHLKVHEGAQAWVMDRNTRGILWRRKVPWHEPRENANTSQAGLICGQYDCGSMLCAAKVFRLGVSQHIEHLVQTAQDPLLTSMALKCIQDTVEAFLIYHTSGGKGRRGV